MLTARAMFIWKLPTVISAELGVKQLAAKAAAAKLSSVWIKVAVGASEYTTNIPALPEVVAALSEVGVKTWGWHEPRCASTDVALREAEVVADLADRFLLRGILMDAEQGEGSFFFQGNAAEADAYSARLRERLDSKGLGCALCSHDVPQNFPTFPFSSFTRHASLNCPQVYYGGSPSVQNRLDRAMRANADVDLPFIPVGAAWVGSGGGCSSASVCAERALSFIHLCTQNRFQGYSFWHWAGAPAQLWQVLIEQPVFLEPVLVSGGRSIRRRTGRSKPPNA